MVFNFPVFADFLHSAHQNCIPLIADFMYFYYELAMIQLERLFVGVS